MVIDATQMTNWNNDTELAIHTYMVNVVLAGKEQTDIFTREYGRFRMRSFMKGPQQCFNCQKFGHQVRSYRSEIQCYRYCAGRKERIQPIQRQITLKCASCGKRHVTTSRLSPKRLGSREEIEDCTRKHHFLQLQLQFRNHRRTNGSKHQTTIILICKVYTLNWVHVF